MRGRGRQGPPQNRRGRQAPPPRAGCDIVGHCEGRAVSYYIGFTFDEQPVVLYACIDHDAWWADRHPEMERHESRL